MAHTGSSWCIGNVFVACSDVCMLAQASQCTVTKSWSSDPLWSHGVESAVYLFVYLSVLLPSFSRHISIFLGCAKVIMTIYIYIYLYSQKSLQKKNLMFTDRNRSVH